MLLLGGEKEITVQSAGHRGLFFLVLDGEGSESVVKGVFQEENKIVHK